MTMVRGALVGEATALASLCFRAFKMDFVMYTMEFPKTSLSDLTATIWKLKKELLGRLPEIARDRNPVWLLRLGLASDGKGTYW